ncbi:hypothetical protein [Pseudoflavonifractor phocaeensis]|uniref:hypothetical protein n=1 Tax=Pseudoflavonifractor phocaeensis TaxID=1870988 RepID=UPI00195B2BD5|nr:hypothetical protein [Pseudoflavonifractor phocaeensis]MBM6723290.1 hypothetical protein [Pseudoflavonifractor phocaeensis]
MSEKELWQEWLQRSKNFRDYVGTSDNEDVAYSDEEMMFNYALQHIYLTLKLEESNQKPPSEEERIKLICSRVYDAIADSNELFLIFRKFQPLYQDIFDICLFMTLSMFIHTSTRIKASSLREFTYQYSHMGFSNQPSKKSDTTLRDLDGESKDHLRSIEATLRKYRNREFSKRTTKVLSREWSAMPKSSEHEWSLYFAYQDNIDPQTSLDPEMQDTLKRIGNLNNDIIKARDSEKDSGYVSRLQDAYKKFCSKAKKIQYKNYLNLCRHFLEHIEKEPRYYGINLYRLEKKLRIYEISREVNLLRQCTDEEDKSRVLLNYMATKNICFPRLRKRLHELRSPVEIQNIAVIFQNFIDRVIKTSRRLLDKFIEDGVLGENWEGLFLDTINKLTENVLFNPKSIDYTSEDTSFQEEFERILKTETEIIINFQPDPSATNIVG